MLILIIDDSLPVREGFVDVLRRQLAALVDAVATAEQGLNFCKTVPPDVVFIDEKLPGRNGSEVVAEIKRLCPDAFIVGMSLDDRNSRRMREAGVDYFFDKVANREGWQDLWDALARVSLRRRNDGALADNEIEEEI